MTNKTTVENDEKKKIDMMKWTDRKRRKKKEEGTGTALGDESRSREEIDVE